MDTHTHTHIMCNLINTHTRHLEVVERRVVRLAAPQTIFLAAGRAGDLKKKKKKSNKIRNENDPTAKSSKNHHDLYKILFVALLPGIAHISVFLS